MKFTFCRNRKKNGNISFSIFCLHFSILNIGKNKSNFSLAYWVNTSNLRSEGRRFESRHHHCVETTNLIKNSTSKFVWILILNSKEKVKRGDKTAIYIFFFLGQSIPDWWGYQVPQICYPISYWTTQFIPKRVYMKISNRILLIIIARKIKEIP